MKITLENDRFTAVINNLGAEINSFRDKKSQTSYIFEGPESVWKFHAPVLFPHVGRILDGYMMHGGKKYELKVNGFSRDMEHKLISSNKTTAEFELTESSFTQSKYPWSFSLVTHYELKENGLNFTTTVTNKDSEIISFSLGSHSAFCCPRNTDAKDVTNADYQIEFEKKENLVKVLCTPEGYLLCDDNGKLQTAPYNEKSPGIIPLSEAGFGNGHFFTDFKSAWVGLRNKKDGSLIKVNTKNYPYLMIWQNAGKPCFVCIEPWCGTPDSSKTTHNWEDKIGLINLKVGESWTCDQSFIIEN